MTKKVKLYVATFADAVSRAVKVAPNKGAAYDVANGLLLTIDPDNKSVEVRSPYLEIFYRERIKDVVDWGDERVVWRVNSNLLHGILQGLPVEGEILLKQDDDNDVRFWCGKKQGKMRLLANPDRFPSWDEFPDDGFVRCDDLGRRINQVAWAVDAQSVPLTGIHINGEYAIATDRYKLAMVPLEVAIDKKVTVPLALLANVLANLPGEMSIKTTEDVMMLKVGEEIEVLSTLYAATYPNVSKVLENTYQREVKIPREALIELIEKMLVVVKTDRYPRMTLTFEEGQLRVHMVNPEIGEIEDILDIEWKHEPFTIDFTPQYVTQAMAGTDDPNVTWAFNGPFAISYIKDKADYQAWVMPRKTTDPEET